MHPIVMTVKENGRTLGIQGRQYLVAAGGLLGAVAASSCCIVPLILFGLGVSGAWIGNLTRLAPYQPHLDRKSTRLNSSHTVISYAVFCLKKKKTIVGILLHNAVLCLSCEDH